MVPRSKKKELEDTEIERGGTHPYHEEYVTEEIFKKRKKKKKGEIEEEGTHPYHEDYVREGIVKE